MQLFNKIKHWVAVIDEECDVKPLDTGQGTVWGSYMLGLSLHLY